MLNFWKLAVTCFVCLVARVTFAEPPTIGFVKTVQGEAFLELQGKSIKVVPGSPVKMGEILKTGKQGSMGITFKDNTIISLGSNTEISVDEYLYDPKKDNLKLSAKIAKGSLNYLSGIIAKLKPEAISFQTPTGTIGIRGTHFLAKIDPKE